MFKVVFDSNIFISSIVYGGKPRKVFELVVEGKIGLYVSKEILREVAEVLQRPKFKYPSQMIDLAIAEIQNISKIVVPRQKINYIKDDPEDNMVLECAVGSKAHYIISGDEHLLNIKKYKNIQIFNAAIFLEKIKL